MGSTSLQIVKENWSKILLIQLVLYVPLYVGLYFLVNIFLIQTQLAGLGFLGLMFNLFFSLIAWSMVQIPFILLVASECKNERISFRSILFRSLEKAFPVYVFGIVFAVMVSLGFTLLIVPGLVAFIFFFFYPQFMLLYEQKGWQAMKESARFVQKNIFKTLGYILISTILIAGIESFALVATVWISSAMWIVVSVQTLLNMTFASILTIILSVFVVENSDFNIDY